MISVYGVSMLLDRPSHGVVEVVTCAAPSHLERRDRPPVPKDLPDHDCLRYNLDPTRKRSPFDGKSARSTNRGVSR